MNIVHILNIVYSSLDYEYFVDSFCLYGKITGKGLTEKYVLRREFQIGIHFMRERPEVEQTFE